MFKVSAFIKKIFKYLNPHIVLRTAGYVIAIVVAISLTDAWLGLASDQGRKIARNRDATQLTQELLTHLATAESAQRGYLINLAEEHLTAFDQEVERAREKLRRIEYLLKLETDTGLRDADLAQLKTITSDVESKINEMQMSLEMTHKGRFDAALEMIRLEKTLVTMARLRLNAQTLIESKKKQLTELRKAQSHIMIGGRIAVVGGVVFALILLFLIVRRLFNEIIVREKLSSQLEKDVEDSEKKLQERMKLLETLAVDYQYDVERERRKLARELHDELGSILTATKMDIAWVMRKIKSLEPEASEKLAKTSRYLDQGIQFKRRVVEELHPSLLSTFGLIPALNGLIESAAERNGWQLDVILPNESLQISDALGLIIFRLVQETLNNASKYAKATKVAVHLQHEEDCLKLEIEDNGVGMDMKKVNATTHGLKGMLHRVDAIGGKISITSAPGEGMRTLVLIPIDAAQDKASQP